MLKSLVLLLTILSVNSSFAFSKSDESRISSYTKILSPQKRFLYAAETTLELAAKCGQGTALVITSALADTIPFINVLPDLAIHVESRGTIKGYDYNGSFYSIFGGLVIGTTVAANEALDFLGVDLLGTDDLVYDLKDAYDSTRELGIEAFSNNGYCTEKFEKLGVILKASVEEAMKK